MGTAAGYIRRSANDAGGHVSREEQEAIVGQLAARYGETLGEVFADWGRSGGDAHDESDALAHRPGFRGLLRAIESGQVSAVFAHRVDRFGRSTHALGRLWAVCQEHGARVITTEGDLSDGDDPAVFLIRHTFEGFAVYYLKEQTAKNRRAMAYCRRRGDEFGTPRYGYEKRTPKRHGTARVEMVKADPEGIAAVLAAYQAAGHNYRQAALRLNQAGVKAARSDKWYATSVAAIVKREAPELAKRSQERRARQTIPRLFRGLLRCFCGSTMTPQQGPRSLSYVCPQGHHDARHPRPVVVSERKLLPWIKEEAARLAVPGDELVVPGEPYDDGADRAALEGMRAAIGEDAYALAVSNLDRKRAEQGERVMLRQAIPPRIDWELERVEDINASLRAMWRSVSLGPDLLPVEADWIVPEWRTP